MRLRHILFLVFSGLLVAPPLDAADVAIHDVQGAGAESPRAGQSVSTTGVVTARKGNGFFLQAPDSETDADPATSEGVFVFTSSEPTSSAAVGSRVRVTGTVLEYRPSSDPSSPPLTEIAGNPQVALLSTGNALPSPVLLTPADLSPALPADRLERYEGMRVRVDPLLVVAPTGGTVDESTATARTNGVFFGVLAGTPRPFREAGFDAGLALPSGSPCCVPRFDGNPERLRVDSDGLSGVAPLDVAAGTTLSGLVGPLDYAYRTYTLLPESAPSVSGSPAARAVPVPSAGDLTVGSLNLERFFDARASGAGPTLSPEAYEARLKKASLAIRTLLRSPDVLAVVEVEDLSTLGTLASRITADALAAGAPDPAYQAFLVEGNDSSGIDVGFLVAGRVAVLSVVQEGKSATYPDPTTGSALLLNDRPPLVLTARRTAPDGTAVPFTVVANHLRSLSGVEEDSSDGRRSAPSARRRRSSSGRSSRACSPRAPAAPPGRRGLQRLRVQRRPRRRDRDDPRSPRPREPGRREPERRPRRARPRRPLRRRRLPPSVRTLFLRLRRERPAPRSRPRLRGHGPSRVRPRLRTPRERFPRGVARRRDPPRAAHRPRCPGREAPARRDRAPSGDDPPRGISNSPPRCAARAPEVSMRFPDSCPSSSRCSSAS